MGKKKKDKLVTLSEPSRKRNREEREKVYERDSPGCTLSLPTFRLG